MFDQTTSRSKADRKIKRWIKNVRNSSLSCFDSFLNTLENHYQMILNYFDHRHSSGFVEGINN
ncbi:MAG: transposase, partial [SAR324 cluster bacterium]|nr:transposase [SAR324 cluster bacterium]